MHPTITEQISFEKVYDYILENVALGLLNDIENEEKRS